MHAFTYDSPWFEGTPGSALLAAETELMRDALDDVFGWEMLQVGLWGPPRGLLRASRSRQQTVVSTAGERGPGIDIVSRWAQLPIANGTMDAVFLPHTLEFAPDPQALIREADRVLAGEGQLIVLGFRPFSLWGLRARAARGAFPPGLRHLLGEGRVRDWLALLGYEVVATRRYLYAMPWSAPMPAAARAGRLLRRGLLSPFPAGAFLLKARKRLYTLTPLRTKPRERPSVIGTLVEPTRRNPPA